jgi:hypothetical protein
MIDSDAGLLAYPDGFAWTPHRCGPAQTTARRADTSESSICSVDQARSGLKMGVWSPADSFFRGSVRP